MQRVFVTSGLSGLEADGVSSPAEVRVYSGVSVAISAAVGYGAVRLFQTGHPGWAVLTGLIAAGGLLNNTVGFITGKQWWGA